MGKGIYRKMLLILGLAWSGLAMKSQTPAFNEPVNAIGFRFGTTSGISLKHQFSPFNIGELIAGSTRYSYGLTALYERYVPTTAEGLSVYFGGGAHLAQPYRGNFIVNDEGFVISDSRNFNSGRPAFGIDGIVGLEFLFNKVPVSVSAELKPYVEFYRWSGSSQRKLDPGLGLRYHF